MRRKKVFTYQLKHFLNSGTQETFEGLMKGIYCLNIDELQSLAAEPLKRVCGKKMTQKYLRSSKKF